MHAHASTIKQTCTGRHMRMYASTHAHSCGRTGTPLHSHKLAPTGSVANAGSCAERAAGSPAVCGGGKSGEASGKEGGGGGEGKEGGQEGREEGRKDGVGTQGWETSRGGRGKEGVSGCCKAGEQQSSRGGR